MYNTGYNTNYSWMLPSYSNYGWNNSMYNYMPNMNFNSGSSWNTNPWNINYGYQPSYNFSQPALTTNTNSNLQTPANNPTFTPNSTQTGTNAEEEKEGLSTGAKWGIGVGVAAAVALGVELIAFKGKHLKSVWNKIKGVADDAPNSSNTPDVPNTPTTPPSGPTTPPSGPTTPPSGPTTPPSGPTTQPSGPTTPPSGPTTPPSGPTTPPSGPTTPPSGPTTPPSGPTTPPSGPVIPPIIDDGIEFKNLDDAKSWFDSVGIKTEYTAGAERHLEDLNHIKKDLAVLQKNGVEYSKPSSIVLTDWHNPTELQEICRKMNLSDDAIRDLSAITNGNSGYWGTVEYLKDGQNVVFINHSFNGDYGAFMHEMGHLHQDLETSFWHATKGLKGESFKAVQHYILGLPQPTQIVPYKIPDYSRMSLVDIFRNNLDGSSYFNVPNFKEQVDALFPSLNGNYKSLFCVPIKNTEGKVDFYFLNAKKMIEKMASESRVYAPEIAFENVAEIFQKLNQGHQFSDEVMLMYDFIGGGRVPNLVIKGQKYDDYIASLYQNEELLQKLRDSIEIKQF